MRILVLTPCFPRFPGDYHGKFVYDQVTRLARLGLEINLLAPRSRTLIPYNTNFKVKRFPYLPLQRIELLPESTMKGAPISQLIQLPPYLLSSLLHTLTNETDLIHVHLAIPFGFIAALSKLKKPLIITCHGSDVSFPFENRVFLPFTRYSLKRATKVIAVSEHVKRLAESLGAYNTETIYLGVDTKRYRPPSNKSKIKAEMGIPSDLPVIGTLCRLVPSKRVSDMLRVSRLIGKKLDFHLLIGGDGPERNNLVNEVKKYGMKNVMFAGHIWDAASFLQKLDVFILCSEREGLSVSLQEAMSTGCIPVSVSDQGCSEIIENEVSGFLYKSGDLDMLAKKVLSSLNCPWIGKNARRRIQEKFDAEKNITKYVDVYNSVANLKR